MAEEVDFLPTLDDVLNTGVGTNREDPNTPPKDDRKSATLAPGTAADPGTTDPNKGKEDKSKGDESAETEAEKVTKVKTLFTNLTDDGNLTEETKTLKAKILSKFKGASINVEGDILDKDGNVVKAFQDAYNELANAKEDDKASVDKDGNEVDADGNIVKTKAQIDAEASYVNKIHQNSGFEIKNDKGQLKTYSDDEDGISEFTDDLAAAKFSSLRDAFFEQNAELAEVAKHLLTGNALDTFQTKTDYSKLDATKLSEAEKLSIIERSYKVRGFADARIKDNLERVKAGNDVDAEFKYATDDLTKYDEGVIAQRQAAYDAKVAEEEARVDQYFNDVQAAVNKGVIKDVVIPVPERQAFFDYLAKPVKGDVSQSTLDKANESLENKLLFEFLRFKGYDLTTLVNSKAKEKQVSSLKALIAQSAKIKDGSFGSSKDNKSVNVDDLTIDNLL